MSSIAGTTLACWIMSRDGLGLAVRITDLLQAHPWSDAYGREYSLCICHAPSRFAQASVRPCRRIRTDFEARYRHYRAHIFIGALGIAVRFLAPLLLHKNEDPPLVLLDSQGSFVISVLSGHVGAANSLTMHLAAFLGAKPVITTASDAKPGCPALDLLVQRAGLSILDWERLPEFQGRLLDAERIPLFDPFNALPVADSPFIERTKQPSPLSPHITVHWRALPASSRRLRIIIPHLVLGIGLKRGVGRDELRGALTLFLTKHDLEETALISLATVVGKENEPGLRGLAKLLSLPLAAFEAEELAKVQSPTPSAKAGERFKLPPFSVSEAAALVCSEKLFEDAILIFPKERFFGCITLALAGRSRFFPDTWRGLHADQ